MGHDPSCNLINLPSNKIRDGTYDSWDEPFPAKFPLYNSIKYQFPIAALKNHGNCLIVQFFPDKKSLNIPKSLSIMVGRNPNPHIYSSGHLSLIIIKEHLYLKILIIRISSENHLIIPPETRFSTFLMRCFPVWCFKFPCVLTSRHRRADAKARHRGDLGQEILHL